MTASRHLRCARLLALSCILAVFESSGEVRYVSPTGTHEAPFTNWLTAATSIQAAVDVAASGDWVWVTDGVYRAGSTVTPGAALLNRVVITNDLVIKSVNGSASTAIEGAGPAGTDAVRCVYMSAGRLEGFTLTNGHAMVSGDAARDCSGGGVWGGTLLGCVLAGNSADAGQGGGAYQSVLSNCTLSGNSALAGGAAAASTLRNCPLWGNEASLDGGGIYYCDAAHCTITDNKAGGAGGGSYAGTAYNCIIYYNRATRMPNSDLGLLYRCCLWPHAFGTYDCTVQEPRLLSYRHVAENSPCVAMGSLTNATGLDTDGEAWASPPTMGCDEPHTGLATGELAVSIRMPVDRAASGAALRLIGETIGIPAANAWTFGDGQGASNTAFATHAWPTAGVYQVTFTAFNASHPTGVTSFASIEILSAEATAKFVSTNSPAPGMPYDNWNNAAHTIQEAIDAQALFGGLVLVTNGIYEDGSRPTPNAAAFNRVVITNNVRVKSVNGPAGAVIRGVQSSNTAENVRCVFIGDGSLEGFTLTGGATANSGNYNLDQCGGGINSVGGVVSNCVIEGNLAYGDGGGGNFGTYYNCMISQNFAWLNSGGVDWGLLVDCVVVSNTLDKQGIFGGGLGGGAAYRCRVSGNLAPRGAGAIVASLNNCIISSNLSYYSGESDGAYQCALQNCTVVGHAVGVQSDTRTVNCIIYFNTANIRGGSHSHCCTSYDPGGFGNITNVPRFLDAAAGNYRLETYSRCINAGTNGLWTAGDRDLDGKSRVVDGSSDIGAYEMPADSDVDGLSDPWEQHYAGNVTNLFTGGDWDGDGCRDEDEMRAGTNPCDADSCLRIASVTPLGAGLHTIATVTWKSAPGRTYSLLATTNLSAGFPFVLQTNVTATPPTNIFSGGSFYQTSRYYQVELRSPP